MDLIRWSTLAYTMSHDVVMLYAVVTLRVLHTAGVLTVYAYQHSAE